jgi:hypothetical protein
MKNFITNIIYFNLIIISIFYILDYTISKGLRKSHSFTYNNLTKIFNGEINAGIIINGSSKALVQVSPQIIDSDLQIYSYNLGMDGTEFIPQKLQYDLYLKYNKKPKIVIQIVSNSTLTKKHELFGYMQFAPYLEYEEVKELTKTYKSFSFFDYYIPLIRYYGNRSKIRNGLLNCVGLDLNKDTKYKGYLEQNRNWDNSFDNFSKDNKEGVVLNMDVQSIKLFENYIDECKHNNTNIILVYPPTYYKSHIYIKNRNEIISYYTRISDKYQVPFLDYSNNKISCSTEYFYNSQHLNKKGAELFTKELCEDLKELTQIKY